MMRAKGRGKATDEAGAGAAAPSRKASGQCARRAGALRRFWWMVLLAGIELATY